MTTTNGHQTQQPPKAIVKICGLRQLPDAELSLDLGAAFLGCVLAKDSPRCATIDQVKDIEAASRGRAEVVLVFRKNTASEILRGCDETGVRRVQVHGTDPLACQSLRFYGIELHAVFRVPDGATRLPDLEPAPNLRSPAVLDVDHGGAGRPFDWNLLGSHAPAATFIAGGITPDNVRDLLSHHPFGIDVSSGVESSPGVKDPTLLRRLFEEVER